MKEVYEANPNDWIALWSTPIEWRNHGVWFKTSNPNFTEEFHYRLIHIKHKGILKAYLADNDVEIVLKNCRVSTEATEVLNTISNFIENYNPDLEYRLKETKMSTDSMGWDDFEVNPTFQKSLKETPMKWNGYVDIPKNNSKNNFKDYGFTGDFDGEILKEVDGYYIGYVMRQPDSRVVSMRWDNTGQDCNNYGYNLTPINQDIEVEKVVAYEFSGQGVVESREVTTVTQKYWDKLLRANR